MGESGSKLTIGMSPRWSMLAVLASVAVASALGMACQAIDNIQEYSADPIIQGCTLPTQGDAQLRIVNMAAGSAPIDVCVRPTGGSYAEPILRNSGTTCPVGVPFERETVPFATASGSVDLRAVVAGKPCRAPAIAEITGVKIAKGETYSVLAAGASSSPAVLSALEEGPVSTAGDSIYIRMIDAVGGYPAVYFGDASSATLPASFTPFTGPVPFGQAAPAQQTVAGTVDANGYLVISNIPFTYGAALPGSTSAVLAIVPPRNSAPFTLFAAGDPNNSLYPVRGVLCEDSAAADSSGVFVPCTKSSPPSIAAAVFNAGLYGSAAPSWETRHDVELSTLAANPANLDVLCVAEMGNRADQQSLIQQAASTFPYSAVANTDLTSAITNPTDLTGATQSPPTTPACAAASVQSQASSVFSCLTQSCEDSTTGALSDADDNCLAGTCAPDVIPFFNGGAAGGTCLDCIVSTVTSYLPFAQAQSECNTAAESIYAWQGQTPSMILSRYPLNNVSYVVLPSYMYRRSFIRAEMQLDTDTVVDVYCGQLTYIQGSLTPYEGQYGAGPTDPSGGWANEQDDQAGQVVKYVKQNSNGRPAIILGELASSTQYPPADPSGGGDAGAIQIAATNPSAIGQLQSAFVESIAPGYTPQCTSCPPPANPFNGSGAGSWSNRIFTYNFPANAAIQSQVILNQFVVPNPNGSPATLPLSDSFGYEANLLRPGDQ